jgi:predicted permease
VSADFRYAFRVVSRTPAFTLAVVSVLALGIGANTAIFSIVNAVLLRPLPFEDPERLVRIFTRSPGGRLFDLSAGKFYDWQRDAESFEGMAMYQCCGFRELALTGRGTARTVQASAVGAGFFEIVRARPALGRVFRPEEDTPGGRHVVILSDRFWRTEFGGNPDVIGRTVTLNDEAYTIVGVMPARASVASWTGMASDVWVPLAPTAEQRAARGNHNRNGVARLKPDVDLARAQAEMDAISARLARDFPDTDDGWGAVVIPMQEEIVGNSRTMLLVLLGAVGLVLLIACANVGNLFLVRAERRQRELAVRRAIGAARRQLFRAQITEALVVALLAGIVAVALARVSVPLYLRFVPPDVPRIGDVQVRWATLLFTGAAAVLAALLCGALPALRASEPSLDRLRDGSRGSTSRRHWARDGLVVAQTALALVLLTGSALLFRSFQNMKNVDPGYDTRDIFTFQIAPEGDQLKDAASFARFHLAFKERLEALPGVKAVGIVDHVPLNESYEDLRFWPAERAGERDGGVRLGVNSVTGDYFSTTGIRLLEGRVFTPEEQLNNPGYVIVNRAAANLLWPGQSAMGRRLKREDVDAWETVIGVVGNVMQDDFRDPAPPAVYYPLVGQPPADWWVGSPAYVVKTPRAEQIAPEIRALVREVAPGAPMYREYTMAALAAETRLPLAFTMLTLGVISLLAVILGTVGQYGVLSYIVAERTREIGVRMALGAQAGRVQRMVVGQGARVMIVGVVLGLVAAAASTRALRSLLFEVGALDPLAFAGVAGAMVLVGLLAAFVPARRASRVDPMESIRGE